MSDHEGRVPDEAAGTVHIMFLRPLGEKRQPIARLPATSPGNGFSIACSAPSFAVTRTKLKFVVIVAQDGGLST